MVMTDEGKPPERFGDVAFLSLDGTALRGRCWTQPHPRASLVIAHGLGEHGGSYTRLAEEISPALDLDILAFDFRGSGRSSGKRGVVRRYTDLSLDLMAALDWSSRRHPALPRFLLGHSNGGLIALKTVLDHTPALSGLIVSNPSLRLTARVPVWKRAAAEILLRVAPGVTLRTGLSNEQLTRDPEMMAAIASDTLRHGRISPPLYFGMARTGPEVLARAGEIRLPSLVILGGADPIIDPAAGRLFFDKLSSDDKTLNAYPIMRHEPLNELGRETVVADLVRWLDQRIERTSP